VLKAPGTVGSVTSGESSQGRLRAKAGGVLFSLEAGVVGADALREHVIPISRLEHVQRLFLL
jgi:hypothetical protein